MNHFSILKYFFISTILITQILIIILDGFDFQTLTIILLCLNLAVEIKEGDALRDNGE